MKFSKLSQLFLVSSIGLVVASVLTACQIVTVDYVFVASSSGISTFAADSESGALRTVQPTVTSNLSSPAAMAVSADYANLYVANAGNGTVVHYSIALTGALTTQSDTVTLPGPAVALAVNPAGTALYVLYGTTAVTSYPYATTGATLAVYPLSSGTIGTLSGSFPLTVPVANYGTDPVVPTAITVLANGDAVYATAYDKNAYNPGGAATSAVNPGWVFGFSAASNGALTPVSAWKAGVKPMGIVSDPTDRFVYVTDFASNQLIGYGITNGNILTYLINGPFKTGNEPSAVTIDPRGKFLYLTNELDSSVSAYAIDLTTGTPSAAVNVTGSATNSTDTEPVALVVDPALGRFVYTANYFGNSVSGFRLDPNAGTLQPTQATPYPVGQKPTAIVSVPHGNHSTQSIAP